MLVDGKDSSEYLCPLCRNRAMVHMLVELQVIHTRTPRRPVSRRHASECCR